MRVAPGLAFTLPLLAALLAAPVHAVDGVIEINQAKVMAGGVGTGDGPGFPAEIYNGGSYRLTSNLVVAAGGQGNPENLDGILVSVSSQPTTVDIDLNGFAIVGPVTCTSPPLACSSNQSGTGRGVTTATSTLRVHDGAIVGFAGACLDAGSILGSQARNLGVKWCQRGVYVVGGLAENVTAEQNRFQGINALFSSLRQISSSQNSGDGIVVQLGTLEGCVSFLNAGDGVEDFGASVIRSCSLRNNQLYGLSCSGGQKCGYASLNFDSNVSGTVNNGLEIGPNVCNGSLTCP